MGLEQLPPIPRSPPPNEETIARRERVGKRASTKAKQEASKNLNAAEEIEKKAKKEGENKNGKKLKQRARKAGVAAAEVTSSESEEEK